MRYDIATIATAVSRDILAERPWTMWRYMELLPIEDPEHVVSLGETVTELLQMPRLAAHVGLAQLTVKNEGSLPTGTFKARGSAVGITRARELGVETIAIPTAGNAGAAWAAYAARAGMRAVVVMPETTPGVIQRETSAYGADVFLVKGSIADAAAHVREMCATNGWFDASTLKEPYRIEGKKTMGFELAEQLGWRLPSVVMYPTGGGVGLIGMWKAFHELAELGWLPSDVRLPRFVAVQADGCAPIVKAFDTGQTESVKWDNPETFAAGMRVPKALGDTLVLAALRETDGIAVSVSDERIREGMRNAGFLEGLLLSPEGAACVVAVEDLCRSGWIEASDEVVIYNTGTGLKYGDHLQGPVPALLDGPAASPGRVA